MIYSFKSAGGDISSLNAYITDAGKAAAVWLSPTLRSLQTAPRDIAATLDSLDPRAKAMMHLVISFDHNEEPSIEDALMTAQRMLEAIGCKDHHAVAAAHADTKLRHVHVLFCRADPVTKELSPHPRLNAMREAVENVLRDAQLTIADATPGLGKGAGNAETWSGRVSMTRVFADLALERGVSSWETLDLLLRDFEIIRVPGRNNAIRLIDSTGSRTFATTLKKIGLNRSTVNSWGPMPPFAPRIGTAEWTYGRAFDAQTLPLVPELRHHPNLAALLEQTVKKNRLGEALRRSTIAAEPSWLSATTKDQTMNIDSPAINGARRPQTPKPALDISKLYAEYLKTRLSRPELLKAVTAANDRVQGHTGMLAEASEQLLRSPKEMGAHQSFARALHSYGRAARFATTLYGVNNFHLAANHALPFEEFLDRLVDEGRVSKEIAQATLSDEREAPLLDPRWSLRQDATAVLATLEARADAEGKRVIYSSTPIPHRNDLREDLFNLDNDGYFRLEQPLDHRRAIDAMLLAGAAKYGNEISITEGKESSRLDLAQRAGELGIVVSNPELQIAWQRGVDRGTKIEAETQQHLADELANVSKERAELKPADVAEALRKQLTTSMQNYDASTVIVVDNRKAQTIEGRYVDTVPAGKQQAVLLIDPHRNLYAVLTSAGLAEERNLPAREGERLEVFVEPNVDPRIGRLELPAMKLQQEASMEQTTDLHTEINPQDIDIEQVFGL